MDRLSKADRPYALAAAVAHDLNDELTVILSSVTISLDWLDPGDPLVPILVDLQNAAERCAWCADGLLSFSAEKGCVAGPLSVKRLLDQGPEPR